jgi:hypothetical protein
MNGGIMKKRDLTNLAMLGIAAGLAASGCQQQGERDQKRPSNNKASAAEQLSPDMQAFYSSLSAEEQKKFMQLDAQHKMMAVEMANQNCGGQNKCSGMGGCATSQHQCAGQNACKGQGGPPVHDPNKAVEVQYNNQMGQRQKTNGGMGSSKYQGGKQNQNSGGTQPNY